MAKQKNVGSAMSGFERVMGTIPQEAKFEMVMAADSTTEVWDDIDTNLDDGEAWYVYGGEFCFEMVDPTIPSGDPEPFIADNESYELQVQRGVDSEILLGFNDPAVLAQWKMCCDTYMSESGASGGLFFQPFRFGRPTVTLQEQLRVIFRTLADDAAISDPAFCIRGKLLYDRIKAPSIGQSKLGMLAGL
jgi:hypothetical protein